MSRRLLRARIMLHRRFPFLGELSMYISPMIETKEIPTLGVTSNGTLYFNPEFLDLLDQEEIFSLFCHESMHLVNMTHERLPTGANKMVWNIAADIQINLALADANISLPEKVGDMEFLVGKKLEPYRGLTTEQTYKKLFKEAEKCPKCNGGNGSEKSSSKSGGSGKNPNQKKTPNQKGGQETNPDGVKIILCGCGESENPCSCNTASELGDAPPSKADETKWKQRIAGAAENAKTRGNIPGWLEGFVQEMLDPKIPWTQYLYRFASKAMRKRSSWLYPNRRTMSLGIRTPGRIPRIPTAVCVLDTSGSMSNEELNMAFTEMNEIIRLIGGRMILLLHDVNVYFCEEVFSFEGIEVRRGGTSHIDVFKQVGGLENPPQLLVAFTDLYSSYPEVAPDYPVLWVCSSTIPAEKYLPKFGKIIEMVGNV